MAIVNMKWRITRQLLAGFGRVQVQLLLIIALILFNVLNETMGISFLIPAAECDLDLTLSAKGLLSSMTFFGETLVYLDLFTLMA